MMVSGQLEYLHMLLANKGVEDVTGLEHYPHLTVAKPSQELTSGLKATSLNTDGSSHHTFNWTFATKDKLNVFLELKFEVRTYKYVYETRRS
jgi:hypothetical protein